MFKQSKIINVICIVLVILILALALAVGFLAANAMRNSYLPNLLDGYFEKPEKQTQQLPPPIPPVNNQTPYRVRSDMSVDAVYLRGASFGDYDGNTWHEATPYKELIDGKYPATYLGTKQIEKWKLSTPIALEIEPNNSIEVIPHYTAIELLGSTYDEEYNIPIDDVTANNESSEYYRMFYYDYDDISLKPSVQLLEYAKYESDYREFVYEQYLTIDEISKAYMLDIIKEQNFDKADEELASKIAEYVMSLANYSVQYNTELDNAENVPIAFIEEYKEGICKHFATVGTLLFRALGIPARYVTGYMTETVANEWVQLTNYDAHAWVEVYVDGFGWKNIEVTPPRLDTNVKVKPVNVSKLYDGTPLIPEQKIKGLEEFEAKGYTYEVVVSGERTEPGITESKVDSLKIFDPQGRDVTSTFSITYETGKVHVYLGIISLESGDFSHIYLGVPPMTNPELCKALLLGDKELDPRYTVEIQSKELASDIGEYPHEFAVVIFNENGEDITDHYKYENNFGVVNIKANTIILRAKSARKPYDGEELVCDEIEIIGTLYEGDTLKEYEIVGSQLYPGTSSNVIDVSSIVICNKDGEDVTAKYILTIEDGTLTVYLE